jgi:hypothetical protein
MGGLLSHWSNQHRVDGVRRPCAAQSFTCTVATRSGLSSVVSAVSYPDTSLRACYAFSGKDMEDASEHDAGEGDVVEAFEAIVEPFVVSGESAEASGSGEASFYHPSSWQEELPRKLVSAVQQRVRHNHRQGAECEIDVPSF